MLSGKKSMGNHKHGISGVAPKSPKTRMRIKLDAERKETKSKHTVLLSETIQELFGKK